MTADTKQHNWWSWKAVVPRGMEAWRVTDRLTPGTGDGWKVETIEVTDNDMFGQMHGLFHGGRFCPPGRYTRLIRNDRWPTTVMSDTPDELMDLYALKYMVMRPPVERVIINGLGLGCALRGVLSYPHVRHVDVVEVSQPLVDLMVTLAPWVSDPRVVLHVDDAYTKPWPPGTRWDVAWHDIWDDITTDNDYATLHRRYGRRVTEQGSWGFHLAKGR